MHDQAILTLAGIGVISILCQWIAWRVKLPAILFLLLAGIVAGPGTGWLNPDQTFGNLLLPIVSLAVAVILFEGSLTLKIKEIQGLQVVVRRLVTTGVLVTWIIIALATHWLLEFSWKLAFLFGAITVVTGPTVVVPMLRTVRPTANVSKILRWEGIVIDPIGAFLGVLVFQFIISEADSQAMGQTLLLFFKTLFISSCIGVMAGHGFGQLIRRHLLPEYLHNVAALALVCGVFAAANEIEHESGLLAVTVMGVWLTNMKNVPTDDILNFKESLSVLLISGLFIILAARINFDLLSTMSWKAAGVFLVIQFIARPIKAFLATRGSTLSLGEKIMIAWIAPRGIVAAATAAVFALRLQEYGNEPHAIVGQPHPYLTDLEYLQADLLVPLTFLVIIGTVVLQSLTSRFIALRLGVSEPEAKGILVVGANCVGRQIAVALRDCGFDVVMADTSWGHIRAARMDGLNTYFGNIVSEHADQHLDLIGIGHMLALSEYPELNQLACQRYRTEFGRQAIYSIPHENNTANGGLSQLTIPTVGRALFNEKTNIKTLQTMLNDGAKIHKTLLTDQYDFQHFLEDHPQGTVTLFAVTPGDTVKFFAVDDDISPKAGWTIVSLVLPETQKSAETDTNHA
ncbi:cation:proton antiporter [Methylomonas methanica]|uniref:Sodium/hydrogen exchanger n=1 Tax=Methylomonas methanica (strain DSM 25384 / MC09) TaxID=857087 RepID=G0A4I9_METMM|nr:sodium:proton antiporter [Methylomonas methanica]AEG01580.1 sodium/hydrogen exchanger [Methylomonas methanica MC09]